MLNMRALLPLALFIFHTGLAQTTIHSTAAGGLWSSSTTWVEGVVPSGINNVEINGPVTVDYETPPFSAAQCLDLTTSPGGILYPGTDGGGAGTFVLEVYGNVYHNGAIVPITTDDRLHIRIWGNLTASQDWSPFQTFLMSNGDQMFTLSAGASITRPVEKFTSTGRIVAASNLRFDDDVDLNGTILEMGNYALRCDYPARIYDGRIRGDFEVLGEFSIWEDAANPIVIEGNVTVTDTLESYVFGQGDHTYTLILEGNLLNNGVIRNFAPGNRLSIEITGDIHNNGIWQNGFTKLTGTTEQIIDQTPGKVFGGTFEDRDSSSAVIAGSDLVFGGDFNLQRTHLRMSGHELAISGWLANGYLKGARLRGGNLQDLTSLDSLALYSVVVCDQGNHFIGPLHVLDTLWNNLEGGGLGEFTLQIDGDVRNDGLISNNADDWFSLLIAGNIDNAAIWTNHATSLIFYPNLDRTVTIRNSGSGDMVITSSDISGPGAASYAIIAGGGAATVPPGGSYSLTILFTPQTADSNATLQLASNDIGSLNQISLLGREVVTGIEDDHPAEITAFHLTQNYPNPFNPSTTIAFNLNYASRITLHVYDVLGRKVKTLVDARMAAGSYSVQWDGTNDSGELVAGGVYLYRLQVGNYTAVRKMVLVR